MANTSDPSLPNYTRAEAVAVWEDLTLVDDLLAGTRRMWEQAQPRGYIRKWGDEKPDVYKIRRQCESLFDGLGRVLSAGVGMLWAKQPAIEWNQSEEVLAEFWANADGAGTSAPVVSKRFSDYSLRDGFGLILVDHPEPPAGIEVITDAIAERFNLRPVWAIYRRKQIINWRIGTVNNRSEPVLVVLEESNYQDEGTYGVVAKKRYRVLRLIQRAEGALGPGDAGGPTAGWELYEETKDGTVVGGFKRIGSGLFRNRNGDIAERLPLGGPAYTGRTDAPFCAAIPLMGVAFANLSHWRLSTELMFGRQVSAIEQPVVIGELTGSQSTGADGSLINVPGKLKLGWLTAVKLEAEGDYKWVGPSGTGLDQLKQGVAEKLEQIGQMGMSFLVSDTRAAETAQAKELDATAENSTLATAAQGIEDALNSALEITAWYYGIEAAGAPVMTINKDFTSTVMDAATMLAYVSAVQNAGLDPMIMLEAWQRGGRIPEDADLAEVLATMQANQAAIDEAKARAAADRAASLQGQGA